MRKKLIGFLAVLTCFVFLTACGSSAQNDEVQEIPQLIDGLRDGTYQIITLPYALVDEAFYCQAAQKETRARLPA